MDTPTLEDSINETLKISEFLYFLNPNMDREDYIYYSELLIEDKNKGDREGILDTITYILRDHN